MELPSAELTKSGRSDGLWQVGALAAITFLTAGFQQRA
jgi:hypothetical protein